MIEDRIASLEREQRWLKRYALFVSALLIVISGAAFLPRNERVLRARGLVIVDDAGRERILIGAPIPVAANRVRTDLARVRKTWAGRFPSADQYMGYYATYRNEMNGVLILDRNGFDRVAVGDPVPDPNIGRRVAPSTGLVINDSLGFERSGYGLLDVNGFYRVVLGLDSNRGAESVALVVDDAGTSGIGVGAGRRSLFAGAADSLFGVVLRDGGRISQQMVLDTARKP